MRKDNGTMWQSIQITVTGHKYTFTFDGAEDALVVKFANARTLSNGTWLHSKTLKSSRILEKCSVFPARKEYVSMDKIRNSQKLPDVQ